MMGKPQKISKNYYSGKVTECKYSVHAVEETERCSNSCRVDSETSCTPKKNFASKNAKDNSLNIPMQHISASSMSSKELKDLEMRLRGELEKVRSFKMKTLSRASAPVVANGGTLSSSRGGHDIKSSLKRGLSDKFEAAKQIPSSTTSSNMLVMKQCEPILKNLMQHKYCWVFNTPVDVVKLKIPDYYSIIKQPMDLGTVKKKLASCSYSTPLDFASDVRLTFANAMKYNPPGNDVHIMADALRKMFEKRWKPIEDKLVETDNINEKEREVVSGTKAEPVLSSKKRKAPPMFTEAEPVLSTKKSKSIPMPTKAEPVLSSKKRKSPPLSAEGESFLSSKKRMPPPISAKAKPDLSSKKGIPPPISPKAEPVLSLKKRTSPPKKDLTTLPKIEKQKMSHSEKCKLSDQIQSLQQDLPDHIVVFLRQQTKNGKASDDEIEIDIDSLDDDTLYKLEKLMDDHFGTRKPAQKEDTKNCEMEVLVESRVSNLSVPCQVNELAVNEPADEEIDIGGDESDIPPVVSYPPLEIEEDIAPQCSSSGSSSSDSDSSSDDSDSDSSSECDSDALAPTIHGKENGKSVISKPLDKFNSETSADPAINGMGQDESTDNIEPSLKTEECQNGNNEPKKQLSPDKRYRAALLKSRFADTIIKAHEKTLNQGGNNDPDELRREREKLEQQKREEKAKIEAEAKAAENAQKQQAAAEAKRKRELEREAARQALQQMEKTVEIDENSLFLNEFEMLGTSNAENASSMDLHSLGGFNLAGSKNPLEELGLFRKDDEEEDDDFVKPSSNQNDVEEGEID